MMPASSILFFAAFLLRCDCYSDFFHVLPALERGLPQKVMLQQMGNTTIFVRERWEVFKNLLRKPDAVKEGEIRAALSSSLELSSYLWDSFRAIDIDTAYFRSFKKLLDRLGLKSAGTPELQNSFDVDVAHGSAMPISFESRWQEFLAYQKFFSKTCVWHLKNQQEMLKPSFSLKEKRFLVCQLAFGLVFF